MPWTIKENNKEKKVASPIHAAASINFVILMA